MSGKLPSPAIKAAAVVESEEDRAACKASYALLAVIVLSLLTRLYNITLPDHVCWDETHFGKMGSYYINGSFFFDVHPPLGKMMIGLSGLLTGYSGNFSFDKPGDKYGDVQYVGMRTFCALLGSALPPLCFCITWELFPSLFAALLSAMLVILDVGTITLTQYILLDPVLLFFIMAATFTSLKFSNTKNSFSFVWWLWMFATGFFLACAISVKFVGLFVVLLVGFSTCYDLWNLLGDLNIPMREVTKHFFARVLGLIVWPVIVYVCFFYIHLRLLYKSGSGDCFLSSSFQSQLEGNPLYNISMPDSVAYGSYVTIKNYRTGGAYLHSHWHLYPEGIGAQQQQVTTYSHKDDNNIWQVKEADVEPDLEVDRIQTVQHGHYIRLQHVM